MVSGRATTRQTSPPGSHLKPLRPRPPVWTMVGSALSLTKEVQVVVMEGANRHEAVVVAVAVTTAASEVAVGVGTVAAELTSAEVIASNDTGQSTEQHHHHHHHSNHLSREEYFSSASFFLLSPSKHFPLPSPRFLATTAQLSLYSSSSSSIALSVIAMSIFSCPNQK